MSMVPEQSLARRDDSPKTNGFGHPHNGNDKEDYAPDVGLADATSCSAAVNGAGDDGNVCFHRINLVRRRQGVSLRTVSRHWNMDISEVRRQQHEATDLTLSQLRRWQEILGVPIAELLVEEEHTLSNPVARRAQMVKVMKTAMSLRETAREVRVQRLVATLIEQLTEIMPELAEVGPWHGSGNRRTLDDFGRAVDYRLSDNVLRQ